MSIEFLVNDWPPVTWWGMVHFQKASLGSTAHGKHGARIPAFFFNINKVLDVQKFKLVRNILSLLHVFSTFIFAILLELIQTSVLMNLFLVLVFGTNWK